MAQGGCQSAEWNENGSGKWEWEVGNGLGMKCAQCLFIETALICATRAELSRAERGSTEFDGIMYAYHPPPIAHRSTQTLPTTTSARVFVEPLYA